MDPCTAPPAPSTWRRTVKRRSLGGAGAPPDAPGGRRAEELEETVWRLRAEKEAAERAAAALRAELDAERGAAETAAIETMLMIARLQREKAAAMREAREFRSLAEGRAGRDRELQDRLAAVSALAASYAALLRAHGVEPDDDEEDGGHYYEGDEDDEHSVEYLEAVADGQSHGGGGAEATRGQVAEELSPPPPPPTAERESVYTADVHCVPCAATTKAVAPAAALREEMRVLHVAGDSSLYERVEALEAESAAMRREVAALRAERERAQVVVALELARRLCLQPAAAEDERAVAVAAERPRFSALGICKWLFSTIIWGKTDSAPAARSLFRTSSVVVFHFAVSWVHA